MRTEYYTAQALDRLAAAGGLQRRPEIRPGTEAAALIVRITPAIADLESLYAF